MRADKIKNIFRQLRWKLTLSYTMVTMSAFLVVMLIMGGMIFTQIFIPNNILGPIGLIEIISKNSTPLWSHVLSQSAVDTDLINLLLKESDATITGNDFLRLGDVQFTVKTVARLRALIIGADGILLGKTAPGFSPNFVVGQPLDPQQIQGLGAPLNAALAGETDSERLYTIIEPNQRFILAVPVFNPSVEEENRVVGVIVAIFDSFPTQGDVPSNILGLAGRSLLIFLLGTGIMGAIFGAIIANGLATRFKRLSTTTDAWSVGDFSRFNDDMTGDEVALFAQHLDNMAKQLQSLLTSRQDTAVSEERNRLARDLHDSAKQQALAASFQLGTALTLYERDPQSAKKHLLEADTLVDSVRKELTNLVHELRLQSIDRQDFSEILKEQAIEWSHRSEIEVNINIEGNDELPSETRETLSRIMQEALANVTRHSSARCADVFLEYGTDTVTLIIKDDGRGFNTNTQHSGLGLYSMRERAEELGGSFTVESVPDQGTQILVTLPILN
jgi:signal transduction histidine kinase